MCVLKGDNYQKESICVRVLKSQRCMCSSVIIVFPLERVYNIVYTCSPCVLSSNILLQYINYMPYGGQLYDRDIL